MKSTNFPFLSSILQPPCDRGISFLKVKSFCAWVVKKHRTIYKVGRLNDATICHVKLCVDFKLGKMIRISSFRLIKLMVREKVSEWDDEIGVNKKWLLSWRWDPWLVVSSSSILTFKFNFHQAVATLPTVEEQKSAERSEKVGKWETWRGKENVENVNVVHTKTVGNVKNCHHYLSVEETFHQIKAQREVCWYDSHDG